MTALAKNNSIEGGIQGEAARQAEQRRDFRVRTVYCIGRIMTGADSGLCRVHNISNGGAQIETGLGVAVGDIVKVGLSDLDWIRGRVAWRSGKICGIRFCVPIDCCTLLRKRADDHWNGKSRPPRLGIHRGARLDTGSATLSVTIRDISQKGMKIRHPGEFAPGARVTIRLDGGAAAEGVVRWSANGSSGIELARSLTVEELASAESF